MLQSTTNQCLVIEEAFIEINTADAQSEDRYCGEYLAQVGDVNANSNHGANSNGIIYGEVKHKCDIFLTYLCINSNS